ncbi:MAG: DDE-type integrase/transposase/recombinase [candidate division WOR-3 bacterium]
MKDHPKILWDTFQQVASWVENNKLRSDLKTTTILKSLDIAPSTFYRVKKFKMRPQADPVINNQTPGNIYQLLPEERMLILDYALTYPNPRHRELAYRMIDEGIVCASPSTIYRVLKDKGLVSCRLGLSDEEGVRRPFKERAKGPDWVWLVDFTYVWVDRRWWYLIFLLDEYSRYIVDWELLFSMDRYTVIEIVERALAIPGRRREPIIQSDNGPAFKSREFKRYLAFRGIGHRRIHPHCPEENGIIERGVRTVKELAGDEFSDVTGAWDRMKGAVDYYNWERRHSALHYLRPVDYYRGNPEELLEVRRLKLREAREYRKRVNLTLRGRAII